MKKSKKYKLYASGLYSCWLPDADTSAWAIDKWVAWIDENGTWWG